MLRKSTYDKTTQRVRLFLCICSSALFHNFSVRTVFERKTVCIPLGLLRFPYLCLCEGGGEVRETEDKHPAVVVKADGQALAAVHTLV